MTSEASIARPLMALAAALAPASRAEWSTAMRQEFDALQDGSGSLGWAAGCVATSLGWRMRSEAPFGFVLVVAILTGSWLISPLIFDLMYALYGAPDWIMPVSNANIGLQAGACFALSLAWPRRAALSGFLVPLVWQDAAMPRFFLVLMKPALTDPWGSPLNRPDMPYIPYALWYLFDTMWPCLLAAALGWGLSRTWRRSRLGPIAA